MISDIQTTKPCKFTTQLCFQFHVQFFGTLCVVVVLNMMLSNPIKVHCIARLFKNRLQFAFYKERKESAV